MSYVNYRHILSLGKQQQQVFTEQAGKGQGRPFIQQYQQLTI